MADKNTGGATTNNWQVLGTDGKPAHCICSCGAARVLAIASLLDGTAAPCAALAQADCAAARRDRAAAAAARKKLVAAKREARGASQTRAAQWQLRD